MRITHSGFAFLLQDINAQIWTLLLQYLDHSATLQMDPVDVLHFLFMLGSLELGQDYSTSMLTDTQHIMLEDLRDYGIVFQRKVQNLLNFSMLLLRYEVNMNSPRWARDDAATACKTCIFMGRLHDYDGWICSGLLTKTGDSSLNDYHIYFVDNVITICFSNI